MLGAKRVFSDRVNATVLRFGGNRFVELPPYIVMRFLSVGSGQLVNYLLYFLFIVFNESI